MRSGEIQAAVAELSGILAEVNGGTVEGLYVVVKRPGKFGCQAIGLTAEELLEVGRQTCRAAQKQLAPVSLSQMRNARRKNPS